MSSLTKSESARANGEKSHGPITEAGRRRSSQNAIKHGFTAQTIVLPSEDAAEYEQFLASYLQHFQPDGPVELDLVHAMVAAKWRLRRLDLIEQQLFVESMDHVDEVHKGRDSREQCLMIAFERLAGCTSFPFLYRVQSRLEREYSRALRSLLQLQEAASPRRAPEPPAPPQNEICKNEPTAPSSGLLAIAPPEPASPLLTPPESQNRRLTHRTPSKIKRWARSPCGPAYSWRYALAPLG